MVVEAFLRACLTPSRLASPDGVAAAFVFVVGGDVADRCVEPDAVVLAADAVEFGFEVAWVGELLQGGVTRPSRVRTGSRSKPGGEGVRASEVLGDVDSRQELPGGVGAHLGAVVTDREQQRDLPIADGPLDVLGQTRDPLARDHVEDRDRGPFHPGEVGEVVGPDACACAGESGSSQTRV